MSIQCQICKKEFKSIITQTHLKTHGTTTHEYKLLYGQNSLSSPEYIEEKRKAVAGKNNPMFGKTHSNETKESISLQKTGKPFNKPDGFNEKMQQVAKTRKSRKRGYVRTSPSDDTKGKISKSVTQYAKNNPEKISERGKKAYNTSVINGTYKNINERFRSLDPVRYEQHLKDSSSRVQHANDVRSETLRLAAMDVASQNNLLVLEEFKTSSGLNSLQLKCGTCSTEFSMTRQFFTPSKERVDYCPTCYPREFRVSSAETEIFEFLQSMSIDVRRNDRTLIHPLEVDLYLPNEGVAIEYDGLYWHSQEVLMRNGNDPLKTSHKRELLKAQGISLLVIFEDEWQYKKDIVKSILRSKLVKDNTRIYARNCDIREVSVKDSRKFVDDNHIQGYNKCKFRYGLYYAEELVSLMSFSNSNISRKSKVWEIDRFCAAQNTTVVGGASKLFKHFLKSCDPSNVVSYADLRWGDGSVYGYLGFTQEKLTKPNYWYFLPNDLKRYHRYTLRKNHNDNPTLTGYENRKLEGWYRIWDCGSSKWSWSK